MQGLWIQHLAFFRFAMPFHIAPVGVLWKNGSDAISKGVSPGHSAGTEGGISSCTSEQASQALFSTGRPRVFFSETIFLSASIFLARFDASFFDGVSSLSAVFPRSPDPLQVAQFFCQEAPVPRICFRDWKRSCCI